MSALMRGIARIASLFRRSSLDRDLQAELDSHLTLAQDDHLRQGRSPAEARARAHRDLGALGSAAEGHREARGWPSLDTLRQDVVYALRSFARTPGFTAIAVIMLALGIGANTAVFSVVNPMMLRPLPFPEPNELVWLTKNGEGLSARTYRADAFESLQRNNRSFAEVSGYFAFFGYLTYKLTGSGGAEGFVGVPVAPRFFELLGVKPELGRHFSREELQTKGPKAALLTHSLWQRRFNADPALVGQSVTLNGDPVRVVGVLPADFDFSAVFTPGVHVDLFVPAHLDDMRKWGNILSIVGRLKSGTTIASAQAEMNVLTPALERAAPEVGEMRVQVSSLKSYVSGTMHRSLIVLWAAVGLVLLIACANLSHLLLARTAARSKEIAVRIALGAGRTRIARQLLTEGVVLAVVGAAVGVPLAFGLTWYLTNKAGLSLPLLNRVQVDGAALGFTMATAVIAGLVFGLMPALRVSRRDPQTVLKDQSRGSTDSPAQRTVRSALVVAEIALACVLLVGAGLLVKSFIQLLDIDLGFSPTRSMAIRLDLGDAKVTSSEQRSAMLAEIVQRASALPGVQAAGVTDALPLDRNRTWFLSVPGQIYPDNLPPLAFVYVTGPGYFDAMSIGRRSGRDFAVSDTLKSQPVMIINETAAKRLWPGGHAIGQTASSGDTRYTVIGVVRDVRQSSLDEAATLQMYLPYTQQQGPGAFDLILRSPLPPAQLTSSLRLALATLAPNLLSSALRPLEDLVDRAVSPRRFLVAVLTGFSLLALILACLGIYGVVSYTVSQRVQEIGLRMALGATGADVRRQILGGTLRLALLGIVLGVIAAIPLARLIAALLYQTSPGDVSTFAFTAGVLLFVALVAGYIPALRASRVDPMTALRMD